MALHRHTGQTVPVKAALLVAGVALILSGVGTALTAAPPDDGLDHGGNPCSAAIFEALGFGSEDTDSRSATAGSASSSDTKGTIAYCQEAARERLALAGVLLGLGVGALVVRSRLRHAAELSLSNGRDRGGHSVTNAHRIATGIAVMLVAIAIFLAAQPLDSGDNFCGSAFVSRGHNHEFNGCDTRLTQQRVGTGLIAICGIGGLGFVATRRRTRA